MFNEAEANQQKLHKSAFSLFEGFYQTYRKWRKRRRREQKERKKFQTMLDFYSCYIKEGDLCFDIGANIGNRTKVFLKLGGTVVAVEPQDSCVKILKEKFGGNKNVHIIPKALDEKISQREIFIDTTTTLSSMSNDWINIVKSTGRFRDQSWDKKASIETTTLDLLIREFGKPSFCKIDVEGFEYNVLRGLSEPLRLISFEFIPEFNESTIKSIRHLSSLGAADFNYSNAEIMSLVLSDWVTADDILEVIANLPRDGSVFGDIYARFSEI